MDTLVALDGLTVSARALGWDAADDGSDFALFHSDLPALRRLVGTLTVNWVDDLGYTQYVVNGISVDPASIVQADFAELSVLTAAGTSEGAIKAWETIKAKKGFVAPPVEDPAKLAAEQQPALDAQQAIADEAAAANAQHLAEVNAIFDAVDAQEKAAAEAKAAKAAQYAAENQAMLDAMVAQHAAEDAAAEALAAQNAVDQYEHQLQVDAAAGTPEPVAADPSLVETAANGKQQLTKEAFAAYLEQATADSVPPGPLGAGQKAAITKKLKAAALTADIAELDAIDAAKAKKEAADNLAEASTPANDWYYGSPQKPVASVPVAPIPKPVTPPVASPVTPKPSKFPLTTSIPLIELVPQIKAGEMVKPPSAEAIAAAGPLAVSAYLAATTGKPPPNSTIAANRLYAKQVAAQHVKENNFLASIGYTEAPTTALEAHRAVLRETGQRKPTGGPGQGPAAHTFYDPTELPGMDRAKLEAIISHHRGTPLKALKNITKSELVQMATTANAEYQANVKQLMANGVPVAQIPHSARGSKLVLLGKSQGIVAGKGVSIPGLSPAAKIKPLTKAAQAKLDAAAKKAAKKAAAEAKMTPAQLAAKPANWTSMTAGEKWSWSHKVNQAAKGIYPKGSTVKPAVGTNKGSSHPLGTHDVKPFKSASSANDAAITHVDSFEMYHSSTKHAERTEAFAAAITKEQDAAWTSYGGGGYTEMNGCLKRGVGCTEHINKKNQALMQAIAKHGSPAPKVLFRGKQQGTAKDFARQVGTVYEDPGFGSWSGRTGTPKSFANWTSSSQTKSVMYRLIDSKGIRSTSSQTHEQETILPPGTKFRVLGITDYTAPGGWVHRVLDVEVIHGPYG